MLFLKSIFSFFVIAKTNSVVEKSIFNPSLSDNGSNKFVKLNLKSSIWSSILLILKSIPVNSIYHNYTIGKLILSVVIILLEFYLGPNNCDASSLIDDRNETDANYPSDPNHTMGLEPNAENLPQVERITRHNPNSDTYCPLNGEENENPHEWRPIQHGVTIEPNCGMYYCPNECDRYCGICGLSYCDNHIDSLTNNFNEQSRGTTLREEQGHSNSGGDSNNNQHNNYNEDNNNNNGQQSNNNNQDSNNNNQENNNNNQENNNNNDQELHSPLDQFNIISILFIKLLDKIVFSLSNMGLFLITTASGIIYVYLFGNNNYKIITNRTTASQESTYATVYSIVTNQIDEFKGQMFFPFIFTLFTFILSNNLVGMIPYSFASTSHFVLTFSLSFIIVLGASILGLSIHVFKFFSILVPEGCPLPLIPLLVLIEFISYVARNISLGLRLAANVLSGHMLLNILSGFTYNIMKSGYLSCFIGLLPLSFIIAFTALEIGIAFIQAQVFAVLSSSYIRDGLNLH